MIDGKTRLFEKIVALASQVPESVLDRLVESLGGSDTALGKSDLRVVTGGITQPAARALIDDLLRCWLRECKGQDRSALAWALRAAYCADRNRRELQKVELVWTGPSPHESFARRTDQVLLKLLDTAKESITLVTFAAYKIPEISAGLVRAAARGVRIRLVLESAEVSAGKVAYQALAALGDDVGRTSEVYLWPLERRPRDSDGHHGSLHVKCAVADSRVALVSSANLTQFALNLNMELGLLISGGDIPKQITDHITMLIEDGTLVRS